MKRARRAKREMSAKQQKKIESTEPISKWWLRNKRTKRWIWNKFVLLLILMNTNWHTQKINTNERNTKRDRIKWTEQEKKTQINTIELIQEWINKWKILPQNDESPWM